MLCDMKEWTVTVFPVIRALGAHFFSNLGGRLLEGGSYLRECTYYRKCGMSMRHIKSSTKKSAAAEKPTFDCVPSFSTIHFLFMLSICLPLSLLSSMKG